MYPRNYPHQWHPDRTARLYIMKLQANVNFDRFEAQLQVVDAHTVGEFCRVVIGGFPEPEGNTMIEKKKWMEHNYDQNLRWLVIS